eukprot:221231-Pelagomonas_calceolata.AAC.2
MYDHNSNFINIFNEFALFSDVTRGCVPSSSLACTAFCLSFLWDFLFQAALLKLRVRKSSLAGRGSDLSLGWVVTYQLAIVFCSYIPESTCAWRNQCQQASIGWLAFHRDDRMAASGIFVPQFSDSCRVRPPGAEGGTQGAQSGSWIMAYMHKGKMSRSTAHFPMPACCTFLGGGCSNGEL